MQFREDIVLSEGMNKDDDPRFFAPGDYFEARNMRVGSMQEQQQQGLVQNLKSDLSISIPNTPFAVQGSVYWLGHAEDEANNRAYLLAHVDGQINGKRDDYFVIYKHDLKTNTLKTIFAVLASDWNISPFRILGIGKENDRYRFYNPRVIDDKLIFTDFKNEVRMIDVRRAELNYDKQIFNRKVNFWTQDRVRDTNNPPSVGDLYYYLGDLYEINQAPVGLPPPSQNPRYTKRATDIEDAYLDTEDAAEFTLIARPPVLAPEVRYVNDGSLRSNQVRGRTWQFSYRYVYIDYRRSVFAPPSVVPAPNGDENPDGTFNTDPTVNNAIEVIANTGNTNVRAIEFVVRSSEDPSAWYLWDTLDLINSDGVRTVPFDIAVTDRFFNDRTATAVPVEEIIRPFDFVPLRAKHMEIIEGNRLVLGNFIEGYDRTKVNVNVLINRERIPTYSPPTGTVQRVNTGRTNYGTDKVNIEIATHPGTKVQTYWRFTLPQVKPAAGTVITAAFGRPGRPPTTATYTVKASDNYPQDVKNGIYAALSAVYPDPGNICAADVSGVNKCTQYQFIHLGAIQQNPYNLQRVQFYGERAAGAGAATEIIKYPVLKTGSVHDFGIIYRDASGRIGPVNGVDEMQAYIQFYTESSILSNLDTVPKVTFKLYHAPPDWAVAYEIVYHGNRTMSYWLQTLGYNFAFGKQDHDDPNDIGPNRRSSRFPGYRLRIKKAQRNARNKFDGYAVEEYVWQRGDRLRVIGTVDNAGIVTELNGYIYDTEITGVYTDTDKPSTLGLNGNQDLQFEWIYFGKEQNTRIEPTDQNNAFTDQLYVEIYRPRRQEDDLYYTTGMTFPVLVDANGNKYHSSPDGDQQLSSTGQTTTPATVVNTAHDAWKHFRLFTTDPADQNLYEAPILGIYAEARTASDFYPTEALTSRGIPIPYVAEAKQTELPSRIRHGGIIVPQTQQNFIADFRFDDFVDLKDDDGPVEGLREVGFTLKCVQHVRVVSIFISRKESYNAEGTPEYLFTDAVFGSSRPSLNRWGTQHPDSVIVNNRHLYFWDQSEGIVVRDAPNGQIAISDYKMKRWFSDKAREQDKIDPQFGQVAISFFSVDHNEYGIIFGNLKNATVDPEGLIFSENNNRWKFFADYPNLRYWMFYHIGKRLFAAQDGNAFQRQLLHEKEKGDRWLQNQGFFVTGSLQFYAVGDPQKVKTFDAIHVYQTGETPQIVSLDIPARATEDNRTEALKSNIPEDIVVQREGIYYCPILRDTTDPNPATGGNTTEKLLNGRRMRGLYMKAKMQFNIRDEQVTLSNIAVISTPSERSK